MSLNQADIAGSNDLGQLLLVTRPSRVFWAAFVIVLPLFLTVPVALLVAAFEVSPWLALVGAFTGAGVGWGSLVTLRFLRSRQELYEKGLVLYPSGRVCEWHQVTAACYSSCRVSVNGIPAGTHMTLRLKFAEDKDILLGSGYRDVETLAWKVLEYIHPHLRSRVLENLRRHGHADFGPLSLRVGPGCVAAGELVLKKRRPRIIPLDQIAACEFKNGALLLTRTDNSVLLTRPIETIPNVFVLHELLTAARSHVRERANLNVVTDVG